jgi:Ca2+:H+ antiporter
LIIVTILFGFVAEQLVNALEPALSSLGLHQAFVGVFFVGVVSNTAEMINAISFALRNKIALSIEIGAAATVQVNITEFTILMLCRRH